MFAQRHAPYSPPLLPPTPLDRNSIRYCTRHKEIARLRKKPKGAKGELPGAIVLAVLG